jgi:hypothetical protein
LPFDSRRTRKLVAATGGVALAALLAAGPARADGDMWNSMLGWVGMGHKANASTDGPDDGAIDYTPKPARAAQDGSAAASDVDIDPCRLAA